MSWKNIFFIAINSLLVFSSCTQSNQSPIYTSNQFFTALNNNNSSLAVDYICESFAMPKVGENIRFDNNYELISNDGQQALVLVSGEILIESTIGSAKQEYELDLHLSYEDNSWCINRESFLTLLASVLDL